MCAGKSLEYTCSCTSDPSLTFHSFSIPNYYVVAVPSTDLREKKKSKWGLRKGTGDREFYSLSRDDSHDSFFGRVVVGEEILEKYGHETNNYGSNKPKMRLVDYGVL